MLTVVENIEDVDLRLIFLLFQLLSESDTDKCDTDVAAAAPTDAGDSGQGQFDNEEVESHVSVTLYLQQQETGPRVDSVDSDNVDSDSDATDVDTDVDTEVDTEEDIADSEDNEDISTTSSSSSSSSSSTQTLTTIREHDNIKVGMKLNIDFGSQGFIEDNKQQIFLQHLKSTLIFSSEIFHVCCNENECINL